MRDENGPVKYQTLMSPRSKTGGAAGLYLPHLKPKHESQPQSLLLTTRAMSIGSSEGSPRVKKSIFSPILLSRESTAASKYKVSVLDMVNSSKKNSTDPE
jgi:hypothetical protein